MGLFDLFGGGSSQTQPTATTTSSAQLPEYAEPYYTDLLTRTQQTMATPYQPYGGQRLAGFGEDTTAGLNQMWNVATSGTPWQYDQASQTYGGIAQGGDLPQQGPYDYLGDVSVYDRPTDVALQQGLTSWTDPGVADQWMNPYVTNVLDLQQDRLNQRFEEDQLRRNDAAIGAGAFGNNRLGVENAIANRELAIQRNELDAQGLARAYDVGADLFDRERSATLADRRMAYDVEMDNRNRELAWQNQAYNVQDANRAAAIRQNQMNADIFAANRDAMLRQQQQRMDAAAGLQSLGSAERDLAMRDATTMTGIGGAYDDLYQQSLDTAYNDFTNQRDWERNQLNFYSGILRGVPISPTQESTTYQAPPSTMSQLLGLGISGLGLYNAFK